MRDVAQAFPLLLLVREQADNEVKDEQNEAFLFEKSNGTTQLTDRPFIPSSRSLASTRPQRDDSPRERCARACSLSTDVERLFAVPFPPLAFRPVLLALVRGRAAWFIR